MPRSIIPAVMGLKTTAQYLDISVTDLLSKEGKVYPCRDERLTKIFGRPRWITARVDDFINGRQVKPKELGPIKL